MEQIEKHYMLTCTFFIPALYVLTAGIFYCVLYLWRSNVFAHKKIQDTGISPKQQKREVKLTLITLVIYTTIGFVVGILYAYHLTAIYLVISDHGYAYFFLSIMMMIFLHDTYFYWTHRLLHTSFFYQKVHFTHHLSSNPSPLTALAFHPVEAVIQALFFPIVVIVLPNHPVAFFIFSFYSVFMNVIGHTGYHLFPYNNRRNTWNWWSNSSTQHNQHHLYAKDNYGLYFTFWDTLMKTINNKEA